MGTVTMPTEVIMNGGAPWGFRLSGGGTQALTVSRLTPGGKAALDGVVQGDHVIAINGQQVAGLQLGELMELIKNTGQTLNLTTISESEVQAQEAADNEQCDIKANLVEEHVSPTPADQRPEINSASSGAGRKSRGLMLDKIKNQLENNKLENKNQKIFTRECIEPEAALQ